MARLLPVVMASVAVAFVLTQLAPVFVPPPAAQQLSAERFLGVATSVLLASANVLPALAEEIDSAEAYNRKVMTGVSVCLSLALVLMGIIIFYTRRVVENKWLN
mmetsp:Transcript_54664/g.177664  ORF Transcript_54664/g.177664 Transcript_54664/m.177664 type:complete len:104 (+) Transcript_54664:114-425(+)|eukprot:CAMPEP_0203966362 /NCGR_PEP_ID=MMETSP0359-20131031/95632_1 /ASSEMBLY_ACC=CAM_ASM_000338 /TAXON_ID=268821 /ORGANISM="Scrippsiella Hangoei, Strain SHTV-5" /LENGTH=103 /DNA_ID=CAMNT_0050903739 /DNA_START=80 /DNA_END=391 /DNA_ORIENTATION=-